MVFSSTIYTLNIIIIIITSPLSTNTMNSNSISSGIIQTQFNLLSNPYKNPFNPSPSHHLSFNYFKSPLISTRKAPKPPPNAITGDSVYTQSPEETLYDLLGVPQSGTPSDIKRCYKQMVLKYHPDISPPDKINEYTVRFIQVQEAYETLSDPEARAMYDCNLAKGLHLAFSVKKGSRFEARPEEMARWRGSWEVQVEELKRRSTAATGGRVSWAARIRQQRGVSDLDP